MKRIISVILCALMLLSAVGCTKGSGDDTTVSPDTTVPEQTTAEVTTEEVTTEEETTTASPFPEPSEEVLAAPAATAFTVSGVFGDHMVIQRNEYIRVWGFADEDQNGKRVNAEFSGLTGAALIENGEFMITLNGSLPESTVPGQFRVYGEGVEYLFDDVLVGDVFWVVGQSNIEYPVEAIIAEPLAGPENKSRIADNNELIRLHRSGSSDPAGLTQGTTDVNKDTPIKRGWQLPTNGYRLFSALGFFTAKQLYEKLEGKIPLGMIEFGWSGAALNAYCPNEVCDSLKIDKLNKTKGIYTAPSVNNHPTRFVYNHYMYPFQNYPICGIIWYQGESDCQSPNDRKYPERFSALITEYRNRHDLLVHDYPVYIIEFPAIWQSFPFASVRQYMGTIPNSLSNAHICQSSDLWKDSKYANSLHPYVKWEQAQRLTSMILANQYGIGDPEYAEGPSAISMESSDEGLTVTVKFRNVGDGLKAEGGEVKGVKVKYSGSSQYKAPESVEITGKDTIVIKGSKAIKEVGYNSGLTDTFPETLTLCNSDGVPCAAFILNAAFTLK